MIAAYRVALYLDSAERLYALRPVTRRRILELLRELEADPFQRGSFVEVDSTGRENHGVVRGDREVLWHVDHADRVIRVMAIRPV